jgi:signal transduction histidine kinase
VAEISGFARAGAAAGEPTLVVVSERRINLLREALESVVIEEARRSHPFLVHGDRRFASPEYRGLEAVTAPFAEPLSPAPLDAAEHRVDDRLEAARRFVADHAERAGLSRERIVDLVLALNEIATNTLRHGGGHGVLRIWNEDRRLVCEVRDRGSLDNPLAE